LQNRDSKFQCHVSDDAKADAKWFSPLTRDWHQPQTQGYPRWIWSYKRIQRVHKCGNQQASHCHADQIDNMANQHHKVAHWEGKGSVLPRSLGRVSSGSSNRRVREHYLQCGIHIPAAFTAPTMIIKGDFNCVLTNADWIGIMKFSKLLFDVWETVPPRAVYTHIITHVEPHTFIEYMSHQTLVIWKWEGVETAFAALIGT